MIKKIALGIEYDGSDYYGWQKQETCNTIQEHLELAISKIANQTIEVTCAGRTDKGVHALEQVINFDTLALRSNRDWVLGINTVLPADIRVLWAKEVKSEFHARHSAVWRKYRYFIYNSKTRPSLFRNYVTWHCKELNHENMQQAAEYWIGEHDFSSFRSSECQSKSPFRCVKKITIKRVGELIIFDIIANAFLHHMVRNMVGTLIEIGEGKRDIIWAKKVLLYKDRKEAGVTAKPNGLFLVKAYYPEEFGINNELNFLDSSFNIFFGDFA